MKFNLTLLVIAICFFHFSVSYYFTMFEAQGFIFFTSVCLCNDPEILDKTTGSFCIVCF